MNILKTGDPCPCCGQPIQTTDPITLGLLTVVKDMFGPPKVEEDSDGA